MDECAQALLDRLTRHMEELTQLMAVGLIILLVLLPMAENPGATGLAAARRDRINLSVFSVFQWNSRIHI